MLKDASIELDTQLSPAPFLQSVRRITIMVEEDVLSGGGEMGALMRRLDWSNTPVGPVASWTQSLRTAISIILASRFPMYVAWGRDFCQFYNDGYRPILGSTKHPAAMGRSTRETFAEIWHIIGPLAIARNLAAAQGGTITAQSQGVGRGSTFTVELPLARAAVPPSVAELPPPPTSLRELAILLVEDQQDTRLMLTTALNLFGSRVISAGSVQEALTMIEQAQPDILVSDVAMPGEDGFDLIRRIRAREIDRPPRLPAIALTAMASAEDRTRLLEAGFDAHVGKPVDPGRLVQAIVDILAGVVQR